MALRVKSRWQSFARRREWYNACHFRMCHIGVPVPQKVFYIFAGFDILLKETLQDRAPSPDWTECQMGVMKSKIENPGKHSVASVDMFKVASDCLSPVCLCFLPLFLVSHWSSGNKNKHISRHTPSINWYIFCWNWRWPGSENVRIAVESSDCVYKQDSYSKQQNIWSNLLCCGCLPLPPKWQESLDQVLTDKRDYFPFDGAAGCCNKNMYKKNKNMYLFHGMMHHFSGKGTMCSIGHTSAVRRPNIDTVFSWT